MKLTKATAYATHGTMYMVRHTTQLPITVAEVAKGEGIPQGYLVKVFRQLAKAGILQAVRGRRTRYTFARDPEQISMLELFESIEGRPLFGECPLQHCRCGGTPENCHIYSQWIDSTRGIVQMLEKTSLETAAWNHPDHRFNDIPDTKPVSTGVFERTDSQTSGLDRQARKKQVN